jgi:hypothetical protein
MISGDLGYVGKERLQEIREEIGDVERMMKAMIKSLENKHLNPRLLDPLAPFSQLLIGRRTYNTAKRLLRRGSIQRNFFLKAAPYNYRNMGTFTAVCCL